MPTRTLTFSIYRFQLVPLHTVKQTQLFPLYESYEDLIRRKNEFLFQVITSGNTRYRGRGYNVLHQIEFATNEIFLLRLGVEKNIEIHREDFRSTFVKDYPNIYVYIDNNPERQFIAVQNNLDAFSDTVAVVNILREAYNRYLSAFDLVMYIEQTFNEQEFWDTINEYEGRITALHFEFIKPNLANISKSAVEQLRLLKNSINSHRTDLEFHAPQGGVLENLNPNNTEIEGLVQYNQEGGGPPPKIKAIGIRKYIVTTKSERKIEIDEIEGDGEAIVNMLKSLLK